MKQKEIFLWAIIGLLLVPFVAYGLSTILPVYDSFIVTSGSMEPEILTGSIIYVKNTDPSAIQVNDTITFQSDDHFTTHKVIERQEGVRGYSYRTKGVANEKPDPGWITEDQLVGKVVFSVPYLGYLVNWAGTFYGLVFLVIIPAAIILAYEFKTILIEVYNLDEEQGLRGFIPAVIPALILLLLAGVLGWQMVFYNGDAPVSSTIIGILITAMLFLGIIVLEIRERISG